MESESMRPKVIFLDRQQVASRVISCGDPERVNFYACNLLSEVVRVSTDRNYAAFTGRYNGVEFSLVQHGVGGSSVDIVMGDMPDNVKVLVRIGSGEANRASMIKGDIVVPRAALKMGGVISELREAGHKIDTKADPNLVELLRQGIQSRGMKLYGGLVYSSDTFILGRKAPPKSASVVDMECATMLAEGNLYEIQTAAVLLVNKNLVRENGYDLAKTISDETKLDVGRVVADALIQVGVEGKNRIAEFIGPDWKPRG